MTTLSDVAIAAGVSTTTVSHVINGTRHVSAATIERVRAAIATTGYRPNAYARALRTATTDTVGFIASDVANPYSTGVMRGITSELRASGRTLLVATSDEEPELELEAIDSLVQRRVDGLIIALTSESPASTVARLHALDVPVVLIDRAYDDPIDQVLVENRRAVAGVVGELLDCGHRHVAMVAGREHHSTTAERVAGWRDAHRDRRIPIDERMLLHIDGGADDAEMMVGELLDSRTRPTAVFAANNVLTLGVLRALRARSLSVPADLSFAAFDDVDWADLLQFPVTALAQPEHRIGVEAVRLLRRRIDDADAPIERLRLEPILHRRASIAPPA